MKIYQFKRTQLLPIRLDETWDFFSSPQNLVKITPARMNFRILHHPGTAMHAGQIIHYKVKVLPVYTVKWITEITQVNKPFHFVDEQRLGPYSFWHHEHHFKEVPGGVEMTDEVSYSIPLGWIGQLANRFYVHRELCSLFDYRHAVLENLFGKMEPRITEPT